MSKIIDLNKEREINAMIDRLGALINNDSKMNDRTISVLNEELIMKSDDTVILSVRIPKELMDWLDSYTRIKSIDDDTRITRTMTVVNFLETMRAIIKERERTEWGGKSHQQMIADVISKIQSTGKLEG